MDRRRVLKLIAGLPFAGGLVTRFAKTALPALSRVRPGDPGWPSADDWQDFSRGLQGKLMKAP